MVESKKAAGAGLLVAAALIAAPANAAVIYLECTIAGGPDGQAVWKLALDEAARTISFEHFAASGSERAIFAADKVTWNGGRMVINRVDLTFTRVSVLGETDVGKCKVVSPPKRAF